MDQRQKPGNPPPATDAPKSSDARPATAPGRRRHKVWLRALAAVVVVGVATALWTGSRIRASPPASGGPLVPPAVAVTDPPVQAGHAGAAQSAGALTVAAFNIASGRGHDRRADLSRTAATIRAVGSVDVVGLNEVDVDLTGGGGSQDQVLAQDLTLGSLFAPSEMRWWRPHFGNAMLFRVPIRSWRSIPLAGKQDDEHRAALVAVIDIDGVPVTVIVTHLDRTLDRLVGLSQVKDLFLATPAPVILMGDLNTRRTDRALADLLAVPGVVDALASLNDDPAGGVRIDHILVRGLAAESAGLIDQGASDHPLVFARLRVDPTFERGPRVDAAAAPPHDGRP